eukprot:scaffold35342_cov112-Isochrysis_galbana.AAC.3
MASATARDASPSASLVRGNSTLLPPAGTQCTESAAASTASRHAAASLARDGPASIEICSETPSM